MNFDNIKREPLITESQYINNVSFIKENYIDRDADSFLSLPHPHYVNVKGISWDWCYQTLQLTIELYSGGEPIDEIKPYAEYMFSQFERHKTKYPEYKLKIWEPDAYQYALWLLSIAVLFNMPDRVGQIASYISTDPEDGEDFLLHRLFARAGIRLPGHRLMHEKPYFELLNALDTRGDEQQQAVRAYLKLWYRGMRNCYWHDRHKGRPDAGFFGYWALEAGMVTVLWDIDDTPYRDLLYYPKDLVDHAREHKVALSFPEGRTLPPHSGVIASTGEICPVTGVWICEDWPVGPQTIMQGVEMPGADGKILRWRLVKGN